MSAAKGVNDRLSQALLTHAASKVPTVTIYFWVVKILTTGMGESASDFSVKNFGPVAVGVAGIALTVSLVLQFRAARYYPWIYWTAIAMVSLFGTMAADIPHFLGVPLYITTSLYFSALIVIFWVWRSRAGTLSFDTINTRSREGFYWASVIATFALGTALGDLAARIGGAGFLVAGLTFTVAILIPVAARHWAGLNAVAAFWAAYVLTRPLGASFADWMAVPVKHGGLGLGAGLVAALWGMAIVGFLTYLAVSRTRTTGTTRRLGENARDAKPGPAL